VTSDIAFRKLYLPPCIRLWYARYLKNQKNKSTN